MTKEKDYATSYSHHVHRSAEIKTPWKSVYVTGACSFAQSAQYSIYISSMWPYLETLDPNATEKQFGFIMTLYSLASCISAPLLGYWSNRIEQVEIPLLVSFCCMVVGNALYLSLSFATPSCAAMVMLAAKFIQGLGESNMSLLRAYVSASSSKADRSRALACVSGGTAIGYLTGSAFQLFFTPLGPKGVDVLPFYRIHIYNAPALFSFMISIAGLLIVYYFLEENYDVLKTDAAKVTKKLPPPCFIAVLICIGTKFAQIFATSTVSTIGSAFSMLMFDLNKEQSVAINTAAQLAGGIIGATLDIFFIFFNLSRWVCPRMCTILCLCAYFGLFATTYPWPFIRDKVKISVNESDWGCFSERFDWCEDLAKVSPWVLFRDLFRNISTIIGICLITQDTLIAIWVLYYIFKVIVVGVSISVNNIAMTTLYSEILGPRFQGTFQGYYQMAGAAGSLMAPVITSDLYTDYGPKAPWALEIMLLCATISFWIIFYGKMVPLKIADDDDQSTTKEKCSGIV